MGLIDFDEALARTLRAARRLPTERVPLEDADGRVLAEDVVAPRAIPPFTYGSMDGYAVDSRDFAGEGPYRFPIVGESRAGREPPEQVPGSVCRSFTGARLPAGCDAVIMQENATREDGHVTVPSAVRPRPGQFVRARGADLAEGSVALEAGTRLAPGAIALLAALDRTHALVARRPVVAIASTGDELRHPGEPGGIDTVAESNGIAIALFARRAGAVARIADFVRDEPEAHTKELAEAARAADLLVTIGGASVGDHDLVRPTLESLGATFDFFGVAMKPGKPTGLGRLGDTRVLCLPGNPASATLAFLVFGVPLLLAMQGAPQPLGARTRLPVVGSYRRSPGRTELLRARLIVADGALAAELLPNQDSGAATSFAYADALVVVPPDATAIETGARLDVLELARR